MNTKIDNDLMSRGYRKIEPGPFDHKGVVAKFQKRFDDYNGKKYFITVDKWEEHVFPNGSVCPVNYEFFIQLSDLKTGKPVNILFFSGWNIEDIERRADEIWQMGCWAYYDKWSDSL